MSLEILNRFGAEKQNDIRVALRDNRINASNRLSNSVQYKVEKKGFDFVLTISALGYFFEAVQVGKPPGEKNPQGLRIQIDKWIDDKPIKTNNPGQAGFLITRSIIKKGTLKWQEFGQFGKTSGILEEIFSDEDLEQVKNDLINQTQNNIVEGFIKFGNE